MPGGSRNINVMTDDDDLVDAKAVKTKTDSDPDMVVGGFGSSHPGGANFLFGDGSVKFLKSSISGRVLRRLGNREDGDLISDQEF